MGKEEAVRFLREKGYTAIYDNGVVIVKWEGSDTFKTVSKLLKEAGYCMSYGVRSVVRAEE